MATIYLPAQFSDNFGNPIQQLFKLFEDSSAVPEHETVVLDYRLAKFTHPFYTLAIPLVIRQFERRGRKFELVTDFINPYTSGYMRYIRFPSGWDPLMIQFSKFSELFLWIIRTLLTIKQVK